MQLVQDGLSLDNLPRESDENLTIEQRCAEYDYLLEPQGHRPRAFILSTDAYIKHCEETNSTPKMILGRPIAVRKTKKIVPPISVLL